MVYKPQIDQKIKYIHHHLEHVKSITDKINEGQDEISLFANIHAFFWECRSILELVAQEVYEKKGDKSDKCKFFTAYDQYLKENRNISYTHEKRAEYDKDKENSLLFYLNEYRNAISHKNIPGKSISVALPEGIIKFKPHRFNKTTGLFDTPWKDMTWEKLLSNILEMTIKIKEECYDFVIKDENL